MFIRVKALALEQDNTSEMLGLDDHELVMHDLIINVDHIVTAEDVDEVTEVSFVNGERAVVDMQLPLFLKVIRGFGSNGQ